MIDKTAAGDWVRRFLYLSGLLYDEPAVTGSASISGAGRRAEEVITTKKLYLDPFLTISTLAKEAGTNRTYLSNFIRKERSCNFREYINRLRVGHALSLIKSANMESLSDVAIESGFSNLRSFNRAFRLVYGKLPSQVRKEYLRGKYL